jgi:hypothetical protein
MRSIDEPASFERRHHLSDIASLDTGFSGDSLTSAINDQCPSGALFGE